MKVLKCSPDEVLNNTRILNQLVFAIVDKNIDALNELLHSKGRFFKRDKTRFLAGLNFMLKDFAPSGYSVQVNKAVCLSPLAGNECIEIRLKGDNDIFDVPIHKNESFGTPGGHNELVIRFAAVISKGRVMLLERPTKYLAITEDNCLSDMASLN